MSQSVKGALNNLRPGDIIKVSETVKFTGRDGSRYEVEDVRDGALYYIDADNLGSTTVEMIKKINPRKPQRQDFKPGDVVTGGKLRQVMWKRGTIVRHFGLPARLWKTNGGWVLRSDGYWHALDNFASYAFSDFMSEDGYEIVFLP